MNTTKPGYWYTHCKECGINTPRRVDEDIQTYQVNHCNLICFKARVETLKQTLKYTTPSE